MTKKKFAALGAVAGALAISLSSAPSADAATSAPLDYNCEATVFGSVIPQGIWTATVTSDQPASVEVGASIPAPNISAAVTTSDSAANTLRGLGETNVSGTSVAGYTLGGESRTANLTIPNTPVPAAGKLTTTASGSGQAETAPATPGTIDVKVGDFTANIQTYKGTTPDLVLPVKCTLVAGQNTSLGTIAVVPKNDGGIAAGDSGNTLTQAGIGIAAVGALAAGGAVAFGRRRKSSN